MYVAWSGAVPPRGRAPPERSDDLPTLRDGHPADARSAPAGRPARRRLRALRDRAALTIGSAGDKASRSGWSRRDATPRAVPLAGCLHPHYHNERLLASRAAVEGERKQVAVLFAGLEGSMELVAVRCGGGAQLLDPVLDLMMEAVHRYEGTV